MPVEFEFISESEGGRDEAEVRMAKKDTKLANDDPIWLLRKEKL